MAKGDHQKIRSRHVSAYKRLIQSLVATYGSINKTLAAVGISDHAYYRLVNDDEIVACTARKIIACYERTRGGN